MMVESNSRCYNIYGVKLGGGHNRVANGIKSGIDEKCGKLFETCFQPMVALFNAYGKKLGEWPKII